MPYDKGVVRSVAPTGPTVEDGEVALARLLRLGSDPCAGAGALAGWVMFIAMVGAVIALLALALGGLV